jgi:hypothetical protein
MKRTSLVAAVALALCSSRALADTYPEAMAAAHDCPTETSWSEREPGGWRAVCGDAFGHELFVCWRELDSDGKARTYCGTDEQHTCGLYAAWAYWACEHGYPTSDPEGSCLDAADAALEACGEW